MGKLHFSVLSVLGYSPLCNLRFLISITALYKQLQCNLNHEISHEYPVYWFSVYKYNHAESVMYVIIYQLIIRSLSLELCTPSMPGCILCWFDVDWSFPYQDGRHFADIFKCNFLNENYCISIEVKFPGIQITALRWTDDKPSSEFMMT